MKEPAASVTSRLADLVGTEHVVTGPLNLSAYAVDGLEPSVVLLPGSAAEVVEVLRFAAVERLTVIPIGGRTKLSIGMPPRSYDLALDMSRMNRILAYDPRDLTLGVEPGVRFTELDARLAKQRQFLPLAPPFADRATLGGIIAAGCDSLLRHTYGSVRDYLLGMEFVTGGAMASKSGGRVVKNVAGYDLHKLLVGSLGTLAVITRINFRTFPQAPKQQTFVASFEDARSALAMCGHLARSQLQPRLVEILNPVTARMLAANAAVHFPENQWSVVITAAGQRAAVERHARELDRMAREAGAAEFDALENGQDDALLRAIPDFPGLVLNAFPEAVIFRIAIVPSTMSTLLEHIRILTGRHGFDAATLVRAAGVVYAAILTPAGGAGRQQQLENVCRDLMEASITAGGRPMIEWCPLELKREMSVWPPPGDERELAQRIKGVFDPHGVLAPDRFLGGI